MTPGASLLPIESNHVLCPVAMASATEDFVGSTACGDAVRAAVSALVDSAAAELYMIALAPKRAPFMAARAAQVGARAGVGVAVHTVSFVCVPAAAQEAGAALDWAHLARDEPRGRGGRWPGHDGVGRWEAEAEREPGGIDSCARERAATVMPCVGRVGWLRFVV